MKNVLIAACIALLAGCQVSTTTGPGPAGSSQTARQGASGAPIPATRARATFQSVVGRVLPVAAQVCRNRLPRGNCNFKVVVDERSSSPPNAFQTLDRSGRPVIGFTIRLLEDMRNTDEMAFILGHEAAHHIRGHIPQTQGRATAGALAGAVLAGVIGADPATAEAIQRGGATIGARSYSKSFELQADELGTVIAYRAGFNPLVGARYFQRSPDPGDRFLGTHPPNRDRVQIVQQTMARLR